MAAASRHLPRGLLPLQRSRQGRSTRHRACLTRLRSAYRVSHPPDGLLSPKPSGLVSCRWRSWGWYPPEPFPPNEAVTPLDARNPHAVSRGSSRCVGPTPGPGTSPESDTPNAVLPATRAAALMGFFLSRALRPASREEPSSGPPPPMGLKRTGLARPASGPRLDAASALRSVARPKAGRRGSHRNANPHEVCDLVPLLASSESGPSWLMVSPPAPSHVTAPRKLSSDGSGLLQEPPEK
jgi:hypothetical protein